MDFRAVCVLIAVVLAAAVPAFGYEEPLVSSGESLVSPGQEYASDPERRELYEAPEIVALSPPAGVDCVWGAWGDWEECSKDCNEGTRKRYRSKTTYETLDGACPATTTDCSSNSLLKAADIPCTSYDEEPCNAPATSARLPVGPYPSCAADGECTGFRPCPTDCVWGPWSAWSECQAECGQNGYQYRKREVAVQPLPATYYTGTTENDCETGILFGDYHYNGSSSKLATGYPCGVPCSGFNTEVRPCFRKECPVDCVWSNWSPWSACSRLCGGGSQHRTRYVKVQPQHGGKLCLPTPCTGGKQCTSTETAKCNVVSCKNKRIRESQQDKSVPQSLCQFKAGSFDCPVNETRLGGPLTAVGANPRPNDPLQSDCIAGESCISEGGDALYQPAP